MPCPKCGARTDRAQQLAMGVWRCGARIDPEELPTCGQIYSEGPSAGLGVCPCGMGAVGICQAGCGRPICGDHAVRPEEDGRHVPLPWTLSPAPGIDAHDAPGGMRLLAAWRHAFAGASPGIGCLDCRRAAAEAAVAAVGPVDHGPTPHLRRLSMCLEAVSWSYLGEDGVFALLERAIVDLAEAGLLPGGTIDSAYTTFVNGWGQASGKSIDPVDVFYVARAYKGGDGIGEGLERLFWHPRRGFGREGWQSLQHLPVSKLRSHNASRYTKTQKWSGRLSGVDHVEPRYVISQLATRLIPARVAEMRQFEVVARGPLGISAYSVGQWS